MYLQTMKFLLAASAAPPFSPFLSLCSEYERILIPRSSFVFTAHYYAEKERSNFGFFQFSFETRARDPDEFLFQKTLLATSEAVGIRKIKASKIEHRELLIKLTLSDARKWKISLLKTHAIGNFCMAIPRNKSSKTE